MKYASIDYGIQEDEPGKWRWRIYPKIEVHPKVISPDFYPDREAAEQACIQEIRRGLSESRNAKRT